MHRNQSSWKGHYFYFSFNIFFFFLFCLFCFVFFYVLFSLAFWIKWCDLYIVLYFGFWLSEIIQHVDLLYCFFIPAGHFFFHWNILFDHLKFQIQKEIFFLLSSFWPTFLHIAWYLKNVSKLYAFSLYHVHLLL